MHTISVINLITLPAILVVFRPFDFKLPVSLPAAETLIEGMDFSESSLTSKPINIYIRKECVAQWKWLEEAFSTNGVYCVEGAAGVGKSVITYWCVMAIAKRTAKNLVYINVDAFNVSVVIYSVSEHKYKFVKMGKFIWIRDLEVFKTWLSVYPFDILVLDGEVTKDLVDVGFALYDHTCRSIIFCTSFRALNLNSENFVKILPEDFIVTSWTKEDYEEAMDAGLHIANFDEMYFYGGSSIRYILMEKDKLIAHLDRNLESIGDVSALLSGRVRRMSDVAVNSLMCLLKNGKSIFLSEYVTRILSQACEEKTIAQCKHILHDNPWWQGWAAKLEVLSKIRKTGRLELWTSESDGSEVWTDEIFEFTELEELDDQNFSRDMFLVPILWNQGGYDFLHKPLGKRLQAAIVTNELSLSFKPPYILAAARYFGSTYLDCAFLCRKENFAVSEVPVYQGNIRVRKVCCEFLGQEKEHYY